MCNICPISLQYDDKAHIVVGILGHRMGSQTFGETLRVCLDAAINSATTNRYHVQELEKSEKTAIGTRVEIALRDILGLHKGQVLDLLVDDIEVDIKWSTGSAAGPGTS